MNLFSETWPKIKSGELRPIPQNEKLATHHSIHDVDEMDLLDTESEMKVEK